MTQKVQDAQLLQEIDALLNDPETPEPVRTTLAKTRERLHNLTAMPCGVNGEQHLLHAYIWKRRNQWVMEINGNIRDTNLSTRHTVPDTTPPEDLPGMGHLYEAEDKIDNAKMAMAETQPSWEHRCHAIMAALGLDFGGVTPDVPEQDSWYARVLARQEQDRFESIQKVVEAHQETKRLKDLAKTLSSLISEEDRNGLPDDLKAVLNTLRP